MCLDSQTYNHMPHKLHNAHIALPLNNNKTDTLHVNITHKLRHQCDPIYSTCSILSGNTGIIILGINKQNKYNNYHRFTAIIHDNLS